jgi:hypothetical protein
MAINKNHEFEELDGVKCGIAEKNASPERVAFLQPLLEANGYTVVVVPSPPPKAAAAPPKPATGEAGAEGTPEPVAIPEPPPAPTSFTIGVTDYTFNTTNAIFGRLLRTPDGHVVTRAYWLQQDPVSHDDIPYYEQVS